MRQLWAAALVATAAACELASFTYSAGEGLITLTFDEAVQSRTLNASGIVLQSNATAERAPMQRFRLRGAHPLGRLRIPRKWLSQRGKWWGEESGRGRCCGQAHAGEAGGGGNQHWTVCGG